jgi:cytochrome c553
MNSLSKTSTPTLFTLLAFSLGLFASTLSLTATADAKTLAQSCVACHGKNGNSSNPMWPSLAGQKAPYLAQELRAYRDGSRTDPLMAATAKTLSDKDIDALAEYYAAQTPKAVASSKPLNEAGRHVRARCVSCHGMSGHTVTPTWPNLAGQKAQYTQNQLLAFRNGSRQGSLMNVIANELSEQQIADVAEYYSQLKP